MAGSSCSSATGHVSSRCYDAVRTKLLVIGLLGTLLGACRGDRAAERVAAIDTLRVGQHAVLSDAQVFHTLIAATEIGASAAGRAQQQSEHVDVEIFAQVLHADHTALQRAIAELASHLGVEPEANEVSQELQAQGNQMISRIESAEGLEFDRGFVQGSIEFYQSLIEAYDNRLLPSARDEQLREVMRAAKPTLEAHLQRAAQLRAELETVQPEPAVQPEPPAVQPPPAQPPAGQPAQPPQPQPQPPPDTIP
jgi:putative membrane protein